MTPHTDPGALLTEINKAAHAAGTGAWIRDVLQRAHRALRQAASQGSAGVSQVEVRSALLSAQAALSDGAFSGPMVDAALKDIAAALAHRPADTSSSEREVVVQIETLRDFLRGEAKKTDTCYTCYTDQAAYISGRLDTILALPQQGAEKPGAAQASWQPIATCPHSEAILVRGGGLLYPIVANWSGRSDESWWLDGEGDVHVELDHIPTHWMSLDALEALAPPSAHQSPPLVRASDNSGQRDPSVMPDSGGGETLYAWPIGCRHPNSCNRHGECMYVDCVHLGKPIRASSLPSGIPSAFATPSRRRMKCQNAQSLESMAIAVSR